MEVPRALIAISLLSLLLLLLPCPSAANEGNILATGDVLPVDGQLSYAGSVFVIQDDCNLVLYNNANGFQSNTHGFGTNCTLTVSDHGELVIKTGTGGKVWSSPGGSKKGNYAAILAPDGQVSVFGPSIWSIPARSSKSGGSAVDGELNTIPPVRNLLFSSQVVYDNSALRSRDYKLEITEYCNLEFSKASEGVIWESKTKGKGRHCFLRLDHRGQLAVVDDGYRVLWSSRPPAAEEGNYVLVVEIHGQAVVYGPAVWSTRS
ncbi:Mannose-specific lectin 2 [Platanthera guangdongensis]|uniref:Mannose-specific lectin 2 n=1 Tax=Platanthera guangdongensis TaxID=2320717 RepID=A0ABR2M8A8_9ASPA